MSLLKSNPFDANASLVGVDGNDSALCGACRTCAAYDLNEIASSNFLHADIPASGRIGRERAAMYPPNNGFRQGPEG